MAFITEDGTGLLNSNAWISVAYFKDYHDTRGNDYSGAASDTVIEQKIVQATDYITRRFMGTWIGYRQGDNQSLDWPRISAFYPDGRAALGVPLELKQACAEYALRAIADTLAPDPTYDDTNAPIVSREEQVGPIREAYTFGYFGATTSFRKYPLADSLLKELTVRGRELLRV